MNVLLILFNEPRERLNSAPAPPGLLCFRPGPGILLGGPPTTLPSLDCFLSLPAGERECVCRNVLICFPIRQLSVAFVRFFLLPRATGSVWLFACATCLCVAASCPSLCLHSWHTIRGNAACYGHFPLSTPHCCGAVKFLPIYTHIFHLLFARMINWSCRDMAGISISYEIFN